MRSSFIKHSLEQAKHKEASEFWDRGSIIDLIEDFKIEDPRVIEKTFLEGYCYDFAFMLWRVIPEANIYFAPKGVILSKSGHYVLEYDGRLFDVRGHIGKYNDYKEYLELDSTLNDIVLTKTKNKGG